MTLADFARELEERQAARRKAEHSTPWLATATPASMLGHKCERRIAYQRLEPASAEPPNEELSSIFEEGNLHHKAVRAELAELGYEVVDGETQFYDPRLDLRGHIDGRLRIGDARVPIEIKSTAGDGPRSAEDWASADGLIGRYYDQLQVYLFLTSSPEGLGLFKNKLTGLWRVVAVSLDYARAELLVQKAERVRDAVKLGVLPDRLLDRSECRGCPFGTTCLPGDAPVDPLLIAEDETLLSDLAIRETLRKQADNFEKLDQRIKQRFRLTNGSRFVVGDFVVTKRVAKNGAVTVKTERLESPGRVPGPFQAQGEP